MPPPLPQLFPQIYLCSECERTSSARAKERRDHRQYAPICLRRASSAHSACLLHVTLGKGKRAIKPIERGIASRSASERGKATLGVSFDVRHQRFQIRLIITNYFMVIILISLFLADNHHGSAYLWQPRPSRANIKIINITPGRPCVGPAGSGLDWCVFMNGWIFGCANILTFTLTISSRR